MTKQQKTALNMAKFIQNQPLLLLGSLTSLISMRRLTFVRNSTMMRSIFFRTLSSRLDALQDGN